MIGLTDECKIRLTPFLGIKYLFFWGFIPNLCKVNRIIPIGLIELEYGKVIGRGCPILFFIGGGVADVSPVVGRAFSKN